MKAFKRNILAFLAAALIRILRATWRVEVTFESCFSEKRPRVFCFWHGSQAALFAYRHLSPISVLTSLSEDGRLQSQILTQLGYSVCRGSSSRNGISGLKSIVRSIYSGCDAAFAVDGPRGPYHRAKGGAIAAAKCGNALVVPVASGATRFWVFKKAWDFYTLPKPFARVVVRFGKPLVADDVDTELLTTRIDSLHKRVKDELFR